MQYSVYIYNVKNIFMVEKAGTELTQEAKHTKLLMILVPNFTIKIRLS